MFSQQAYAQNAPPQQRCDHHNASSSQGPSNRPLGLFASPTTQQAPNERHGGEAPFRCGAPPPPPPTAQQLRQHEQAAHVLRGCTFMDYAPPPQSPTQDRSHSDTSLSEDSALYKTGFSKDKGSEPMLVDTDAQSVMTTGTSSTGTGTTYAMTNEALSERLSMPVVPSHAERVAEATASDSEAWQRVDRNWYPAYHVAACANWLSVPGGLCFHDGDYHLFYQHNPFGTEWGPMHWGHAISKDLIHWRHLPVALAPGEPYDRDGCFSGSAVSYQGKLYLFYTGHTWFQGEGDSNIYQMQCLAVSEDGVHFEKRGPIARPPAKYRHCRDPKVWQREDGLWCMVLGARDVAKDLGQLLLYTSDSLTRWNDTEFVVVAKTEDRNTFMWECPDFFPYQPVPALPAPADHARHGFESDGTRGPLPAPCVNTYALLFCPQGVMPDKYRSRNRFQAGTLLGRFVPNGSDWATTPPQSPDASAGAGGGQGRSAFAIDTTSSVPRRADSAQATHARQGFDGTQKPRFVVTRQFREIDYGHDFYAPQSFVAPDGRRILMAWMDMWASPMPSREYGWSGCVTLPRELVITEHGETRMMPIRELVALRRVGVGVTPQEIDDDSELPLVEECTAYEVEVAFNVERSTAEKYGLWLGSGAEIYVDAQAERLVVSRHYPEYMLSGNRSCALPDATELRLRVYFDRSSMEVFVNDGEACFSTRIYPNANDRALRLFSINGTAALSSGTVWQLDSSVVEH